MIHEEYIMDEERSMHTCNPEYHLRRSESPMFSSGRLRSPGHDFLEAVRSVIFLMKS